MEKTIEPLHNAKGDNLLFLVRLLYFEIKIQYTTDRKNLQNFQLLIVYSK